VKPFEEEPLYDLKREGGAFIPLHGLTRDDRFFRQITPEKPLAALALGERTYGNSSTLRFEITRTR
jgi:hypothetical protein